MTTKRERKIINPQQIYDEKITEMKKLRHCYKCIGKFYINKDKKTFTCSNKKCRSRNLIFESKTINKSHLKINETLNLIFKLLNGDKTKKICSDLGIVKSTVSQTKKNLKSI
ncbi:hypothetical protein GVAV_000140 [Gurleya vavrai]